MVRLLYEEILAAGLWTTRGLYQFKYEEELRKIMLKTEQDFREVFHLAPICEEIEVKKNGGYNKPFRFH